MGFYKNVLNGKEIGFEDDEGDEATQRMEEQYMKMFPKIGRDFLHKEDFYRILNELIEILDVDDYHLSINDLTAKQRAYEYKHFLKNGVNGSDHYKDLINLNEE